MWKKVRSISWPWWWLIFLMMLALGKDFLANGRPLYCSINGEGYYPGIRTVFVGDMKPFDNSVLDSLRRDPVRWKTYPYEKAVFAPIPWTPGEWLARPEANLLPPGSAHPELPSRFVHYLGTDRQGRDVAAGMISGARIALLIGLLAMLMALSIGFLLGSLAGFFGDDRLKVSYSLIGAMVISLILFPVGFVPLKHLHPEWLGPGGIAVIIPLLIATVVLIHWALHRIPLFRRTVVFPVDLLTMRLTEVFSSIPILILIIAIASISQKQSTWVMIALIGLFSWPGVARLIRAELLRVRKLDYISAARLSGLSEAAILWKHALPNALLPIWVMFALGVGNAIMLEASLSFLGFGGSDFQGISWGTLMQGVVRSRAAWWLAVPPGLAIGFTVFCLNKLGEKRSNT